MSEPKVITYGGGEYELKVDGGDLFARTQTGLGPTTWRVVESGDGPLEDAQHELARLASLLAEEQQAHRQTTMSMAEEINTLEGALERLRLSAAMCADYKDERDILRSRVEELEGAVNMLIAGLPQACDDNCDSWEGGDCDCGYVAAWAVAKKFLPSPTRRVLEGE